MELPPPSENQPDQPSSSSRLVTLKYVLWESAFSHMCVFSKGNHKLGGKKNTELIDLLHFLILCVAHKYLFSHGAVLPELGGSCWRRQVSLYPCALCAPSCINRRHETMFTPKQSASSLYGCYHFTSQDRQELDCQAFLWVLPVSSDSQVGTLNIH